MSIGCATGAASPEPVPLDRVECARCGMLISAEAGSAQITAAGTDTRFYDDVGCLAADWREHAAKGHAFVRTSGGWTEAGAALFARPAGTRTAMGSGIVAFASAGDAQADASADALMTFDDVIRSAGGRP
jgi:hypothetical protein